MQVEEQELVEEEEAVFIDGGRRDGRWCLGITRVCPVFEKKEFKS